MPNSKAFRTPGIREPVVPESVRYRSYNSRPWRPPTGAQAELLQEAFQDMSSRKILFLLLLIY